MDKTSKILVLGASGMVGSALCRKLYDQHPNRELIYRPTHANLDLEDADEVNAYFRNAQPDFVFLAAAKVGGIIANRDFPVEFIMDNIQIQANVIKACYENKIKRLIFTGSSCIYPKYSRQPIKEDYLLRGPLEPTNQAYAIAKIAGIEMCRAYNTQYKTDFISVMPCNLYGEVDNYHPTNSHVIPGLIQKFHDAAKNKVMEITIWGTGTPLREFMHADYLAICMIQLMEYPDKLPDLINIGSGHEISIKELAEMIAKITGFTGNIHFDASQPDGTPRKILDCSLLHSIPNFNWAPQIQLEAGISKVYENYLKR